MNDTAAVASPLPFGDANVADIVAQLNELDADQASSLIAQLPFDQAVDVLDRPELTRCGELLLALPGELAGRIPTVPPRPCASSTATTAPGYSPRSISRRRCSSSCC